MSELDEYTENQMSLLTEELNLMQTKYDTRMMSALLAGRAAMLHAILVKGEVITKEEALKIWEIAGGIIERGSDNEVKIMKKFDGETFDPKTVN